MFEIVSDNRQNSKLGDGYSREMNFVTVQDVYGRLPQLCMPFRRELWGCSQSVPNVLHSVFALAGTVLEGSPLLLSCIARSGRHRPAHIGSEHR